MKSQPAQSPTSKAKAASASEKKTAANEKSAQQPSNSSKINVSKSVQPEPSKTDEMSTSKKGKQKTRKRMVIEEVDVEGKERKCVLFYLGLLVVLNCG